MPETDGLEVKNPQEGYEYHWTQNRPFSILKREAQGYEVCTGKDKQSVGDLILCRMPLKLAEKRKQYEMSKPILQERYAQRNYFDSIEHTKAEAIYNHVFIKPNTISYKLKMFFWKVIFRNERKLTCLTQER